MLPPATTQNGIPQLMVNAPFSRWTMAESFDSSKQCEKELEVRRTRFEQIYKKTNHSNVGEEFWSGLYMVAANSATCVATDDPRLKEESPQHTQRDGSPVKKSDAKPDGPQL